MKEIHFLFRKEFIDEVSSIENQLYEVMPIDKIHNPQEIEGLLMTLSSRFIFYPEDGNIAPPAQNTVPILY